MKPAALTFKEKLGYGMGDAGCNMIGGAIMLFLNYFYTDVFGLAPALVGTLLLFMGLRSEEHTSNSSHA